MSLPRARAVQKLRVIGLNTDELALLLENGALLRGGRPGAEHQDPGRPRALGLSGRMGDAGSGSGPWIPMGRCSAEESRSRHSASHRGGIPALNPSTQS